MPLTITSPVFKTNGLIPARFTCDDKNISPELIFENIPPQTQSMALTMEDPDVPTSIRPDGMWNHWIVWNISPSTIRIGEGGVPPGTVGTNTGGKTTYSGPCPPDSEHRYIFTLYALDTLISLPQGATKEAMLTAISAHVIEQAKLIGRYKRI
ncbi:MAG: YbhB/YbcL family Raf kinase inhibitor-like protein [Candidatus Yonathbacteria bacterium]|nr:YbhB/YbcL family Raf kinase inhibitor-like protein [Candidatus Yonathbacteria bacterium]